MNLYYAQSTGGFYTEEIHGINIPADAVGVTAERHAELMQAQADGKRIVPGPDGAPIAVESVETEEQRAARERAEARAYLASTDWLVLRFMDDPSKPVPDEVRAARAAARVKASQ